VAKLWQAAGFEVRGLEGQGDHLVAVPPLRTEVTGNEAVLSLGALIHCEVKRQERLRLPEWLAQAKREAPERMIPVVCFRQNRGEWFAALPLSALVELAS
jgi:hypothetical protein